MRGKAVSPSTIREAFQLIAAADRVLASVSTAGKQILSDLGTAAAEEEVADPPAQSGSAPRPARPKGLPGEGKGS